MTRWPKRFLAVLIASLAGLITLELVSGEASRKLPLSPAPPFAAQHDGYGGEEKTTSVAALTAAILERPLFSPNRRPPAPPANSPHAPENLPRLSGIIINPSGRLAIFAPAGDGKPRVASKGDSIGAWSVGSVEPDTVRLTGPGGSEYVHPTFASPPEIAPPVTAPQPGPVPVAVQAARQALLQRLSE